MIGVIGALGLIALVFYDEISKCLAPTWRWGYDTLARNNCRHWEGDYDLYNQDQELPFKLRVAWDDGARLRITSGQFAVDLSASFLDNVVYVKGTDGVWSKFELLPRHNKQSEVTGFGIKGTDLFARRTSFVRQEPPSWLTDDR